MTTLVNELAEKADLLSPDEQLWLIARLAEKLRAIRSVPQPRRKWREIRGAARYPLLGEDAQAWVTRTRRESDEQRERQWERDA